MPHYPRKQDPVMKAGPLKKAQAAICKHCPLCRQASKNPASLIGRLLHHPLHSRNCPVWIAYQEVYGSTEV